MDVITIHDRHNDGGNEKTGILMNYGMSTLDQTVPQRAREREYDDAMP